MSFAFLFAACAAVPPKKPPFDIAKVHRIAVLPFDGAGGKAVADEFVRQLLGVGFEVMASTPGADAVLTGQVMQYQTNRKLVVFLGHAKTVGSSGTMTEDNPILAVTGAPAAVQGTVAVPDAQVISIGASLDVTARLYGVEGGMPVWMDEFSYEAVEMPVALRATADVLIRSFRRGGPPAARPPA